MPVYLVEQLGASNSMHAIMAGDEEEAAYKLSETWPEDMLYKVNVVGTLDECRDMAEDADNMVARLE